MTGDFLIAIGFALSTWGVLAFGWRRQQGGKMQASAVSAIRSIVDREAKSWVVCPRCRSLMHSDYFRLHTNKCMAAIAQDVDESSLERARRLR